MSTRRRLAAYVFKTAPDNRTIIIRIIVGLVFLSEGIQKFLFSELVGTGRFEKIGFSDPAFWAYFTALFEIICGAFVLAGLFLRMAAIPLLIIMITAFVTTKWPILVSKGFLRMAHEYRTDFSMTLLLVYLLIHGSGKWSFDLIFYQRINT
jgi:uncharacterized membrane protein YphA (DoxX/SURF4 family)